MIFIKHLSNINMTYVHILKYCYYKVRDTVCNISRTAKKAKVSGAKLNIVCFYRQIWIFTHNIQKERERGHKTAMCLIIIILVNSGQNPRLSTLWVHQHYRICVLPLLGIIS